MDFLGNIRSARSHGVAAIHELSRYDASSLPTAPHNRAVLEAARDHVSPGATSAGAEALDAARWERWVTVRQIRDTGAALELLDHAWWALSPGRPDVNGARRALHDAVAMLDRASYRRWSLNAA